MFEFLMRLFKRRELTANPWRQPSHWDRTLEQSLVNEITQLRPGRKHNLLVLGPVGAGKSSFVNSILSVAKGRKYAMADTAFSGIESTTVELTKYTHEGFLRGFNLYDCMGIEPDGSIGMLENDATLLFEGHIKNKYRFIKDRPISDQSTYYNRDPNVYDQMHCIIFVMSAENILTGMTRAYVQKMKRLQKIIKDKRIPRILILTKVENICDEVERDISLMFRSEKIYEAVKIASEVFVISQASIHPVKNYEEDFNVGPITNIPILLALRQAMHYATDRVEYVLHNEDHGSVETYSDEV